MSLRELFKKHYISKEARYQKSKEIPSSNNTEEQCKGLHSLS